MRERENEGVITFMQEDINVGSYDEINMSNKRKERERINRRQSKRVRERIDGRGREGDICG